MVRADLLGEVGGFDASLMHVADWDLVLRLAETSLPACVDEPDVAYRWHGGTLR
jgi:GT2 family glycosyltransferase